MEQKLKIMLIEDNPGDARLLQEELIESYGKENETTQIDLRWFNLLSTGLTFLSRDNFDAVLLDLNLPDGSGLDNIDKVKSVSSQMPVIVLSGLHDQLVMTQAIRRGAQNYVVKGSINGGQLLNIILDAINHRSKKVTMQVLK